MSNQVFSIEDALKVLTTLYTLEITMENLGNLYVETIVNDDDERSAVSIDWLGNNWIEPLMLDDDETEKHFGMKAWELGDFLVEFGAEGAER